MCVCCMLASSMQAVSSPFSVVRGRCPMASVPTWLGGSSWRGRFGLRRHRRVHERFVHRGEGGGGEGGRRRALHGPIVLPIVVVSKEETSFAPTACLHPLQAPVPVDDLWRAITPACAPRFAWFARVPAPARGEQEQGLLGLLATRRRHREAQQSAPTRRLIQSVDFSFRDATNSVKLGGRFLRSARDCGRGGSIGRRRLSSFQGMG